MNYEFFKRAIADALFIRHVYFVFFELREYLGFRFLGRAHGALPSRIARYAFQHFYLVRDLSLVMNFERVLSPCHVTVLSDRA